MWDAPRMKSPVPPKTGHVLELFYHRLFDAFGPQGWWPGRSPLEIVVGAILTQNTNWKNVEKAIVRLDTAGGLDWGVLRDIPLAELAELIRPAGYYNVKAKRLKNFVAWLWEHYNGDLDRLRASPLEALRAELLSINGIGPETADSILLYALKFETFVVDAYTRRMLERHGLIGPGAKYEEMRSLFHAHVAADVDRYNEYHALIVALGKSNCRPSPKCAGCPLEWHLATAANGAQ